MELPVEENDGEGFGLVHWQCRVFFFLFTLSLIFPLFFCAQCIVSVSLHSFPRLMAVRLFGYVPFSGGRRTTTLLSVCLEILRWTQKNIQTNSLLKLSYRLACSEIAGTIFLL